MKKGPQLQRVDVKVRTQFYLRLTAEFRHFPFNRTLQSGEEEYEKLSSNICVPLKAYLLIKWSVCGAGCLLIPRLKAKSCSHLVMLSTAKASLAWKLTFQTMKLTVHFRKLSNETPNWHATSQPYLECLLRVNDLFEDEVVQLEYLWRYCLAIK